jgi:hypothetical protein
MPSTPIPGFITKTDAVELYQRSHRQLSRDLADAMKVQNELVLENCRLRTEDGAVLEGMGVVPELIDRLRNEGKNPVWYLRTSWLEKTYGKRGSSRRRERRSPDTVTASVEKGSESSSRPDVERLLHEQIESLKRDKQDLREELRIKNQQIADRVEREKETNTLFRDLHTLMADLQRRLLPPPSEAPPSQITDGRTDIRARTPAPRDEKIVAESKVVPTEKPVEKGSRPPGTPPPTVRKQRQSRASTRRAARPKKTSAATKESPANDIPTATKSRSLWSRLFSR